MEKEKLVIIGGVAAGTKAAAKARRLNPNAQIDLFTQDTHVSYSTCGFPYFIGGNFDNEDYLFARSVEDFQKSNINIHLKHRCSKISPQDKFVTIKNLENEEVFNFNFDKLLIATGAVPFLPKVEKINLKNIFTLRTVEDALAIKEAALKYKHVTIIGGGYIGIELLEAFVNRGLDVTIIESSPVIMPIFDDDMSQIITDYIFKNRPTGIEIITSDYVTEFYGNEYVEGFKTAAMRDIKTDFVVISAGVRPNVELASSCGITLGPTGAIKVNEKMQTNFPDIYAAGDCAEKFHIIARVHVWLPLASTAIKEGRCAALNMCNARDYFNGVSGSAVTKYFKFTMASTGLSEKSAFQYGFDPISVVITKSDIVDYMPDAQNITLKLVADKQTRKLLGAQAIGMGNADKRINTIASSLNCHVTVDEFLKNDLPYSPAFSTSIDPILTATEKLIEKMDK